MLLDDMKLRAVLTEIHRWNWMDWANNLRQWDLHIQQSILQPVYTSLRCVKHERRTL